VAVFEVVVAVVEGSPGVGVGGELCDVIGFKRRVDLPVLFVFLEMYIKL
jgi:hypothetical protein